MELPPSAVRILKSTYASVTCHLQLTHKQRRKVWKRQKRRKKRIINYFANRALNGSPSEESPNSEEDDSESSNLPCGPLTNNAIICYFKEQLSEKNECNKQRGILKNREGKNDGIPQPSVPGTTGERAPIVAGGTSQISDTLPALGSGEILPISNLEDLSNKTDPTSAACGMPDFNRAITDSLDDTGESSKDPAVSRSKQEKDEIAELLVQLDEEVEKWQNPPAPPSVVTPREKPMILNLPQSSVAPSENDTRQVCMFYSRVGACRFWDKCNRKHVDPETSDAVVFPNMFQTFAFDMEDRAKLTGDAHDLSLEHTDQDLLEEFRDFYADVEPEFRQIGNLSRLYICRNRAKHLQGNLYVQYENANDALRCKDKMLGRFFAGRPLFCKFLRIQSWGETLCGVDLRGGNCSRSGQCNFLHVFQETKGVDRHRFFSRRSYSHGRGNWWSNTQRNGHSHNKTWTNRRRSRSSERRYRRSTERRIRRHYCSGSSSSSSNVGRRSSSRKRNRNASSASDKKYKKKRKRESSSKREKSSSCSDVEGRKLSSKEKKKYNSRRKSLTSSSKSLRKADTVSLYENSNTTLEILPSNATGAHKKIGDEQTLNRKDAKLEKNVKNADLSRDFGAESAEATSKRAKKHRKHKKSKKSKRHRPEMVAYNEEIGS